MHSEAMHQFYRTTRLWASKRVLGIACEVQPCNAGGLASKYDL